MMPIRCSSSKSSLLPLVAAAALASCGPQEAPDQGPDNAAEPVEAAATNLIQAAPAPVPDMDRERLLLAITHAASAYAAGMDDTEQQSELANRKFTFRIRFGCGQEQPSASEAAMTWSQDASEETLRVKAAPDISKDHPIVQLVLGREFEGAEGFWVPRPWLLRDACPSPGGEGLETAPSPSVGLVQLFTDTESRIQRRAKRSYETVKKVAAKDVPTQSGLNLVLRGRLSAGPDKRVISCTSASADTRPACLVSVEFDNVAVENPETQETLAEWGVG